MKTRVITGIVLIALVSAAIMLGGWWLRGVVLLLMLLSMHEMYAALRRKGTRPLPVGMGLAPLLLLCALLLPQGELMEAAVAGTAFLTAVGVGAIVLRGAVDGPRMQATLLPLIYPGVFYILMFDLTYAGEGMPRTLLFVLLFLVPSMNDCFALFTGMACGRHKLSAQISPKKTVEGSVGGLAAAVAFAVGLPFLVRALYGADAAALAPAWYYALFGLLAGALSQIGDLAASLVKRDCGIKDFGKIFPGHGGVMDRLDGILFATLACHVFFRMMG